MHIHGCVHTCACVYLGVYMWAEGRGGREDGIGGSGGKSSGSQCSVVMDGDIEW